MFATERSQPVSLARIEEEIGELAAHISAATCRWLDLVGEFDQREGHVDWGFGCCAAWLAWRCSLGPASAREHVRVARHLRELPRTHAEFATGALTYSKVRALTRVATPENEEQLVTLARHATAAQLERLVRSYRTVIRTQVKPDPADERTDYLTCSWSEAGELELRGRMSAADGALLVKALECARDHLRIEESSDSTSPPSNTDALVLMAQSLLAAGASDGTGAERYQVMVHVDEGALRADAPDGRCEIEHAGALDPELARRLACDCSLVTMIERDGRPLHVGRRTRTISPALRRALRSRDGGCVFPGCQQRRFVEAHHIRHWAHGGKTDLPNLALLCRRHHRLLHEGGFSVERASHRLRFRRPDGRIVPSAPRARGGDHPALVKDNRRRGVRPHPETCVPLNCGESLDYGLAVDGLLYADGHLEVQAGEARASPT